MFLICPLAKGRYQAAPRNKYGAHPRPETPFAPDGSDVLDANVVPARAWSVWPGVGFVECAGLEGGLCPWWYVHLSPKMVNKINAIEYSAGTGFQNLASAWQNAALL
jgi:hypothetical protein